MRWHIDNDHRNVSLSHQISSNRDPQKRITSFINAPSTSSQPSKLSREKTQRIDEKLLSIFIKKMIPFSTVEHESFVAYSNELEPSYKVPGRKLILCKLNEKYQNGVKVLSKLVADCPSVALTHDSWTSMKVESFDTVTAHFIDLNWELHSVVLRTSHFEGQHTGLLN